MSVLARLLLINFFAIFAGSMTFFTIFINFSDLFPKIVRYIQQDVDIAQLIRIQYLFLPQSIVYALPTALLFSVSYTMGNLYTNNELIAVFASGISLKRFILPLVLVSILLSIGLFFFQDRLAIPLLKEKVALSREILQDQPSNLSQSDVSIQSVGGKVIYHAKYYDSHIPRLTDVTVILRDDDLRIKGHIYAEWADWQDDHWEFHRVTHITQLAADSDSNGESEFVILEKPTHSQPELNLPPDNFENKFGNIDEMNISEAGRYVDFLQASGFPFRKALTKYHERYSFALTPLIVTLLSVAIGGSYRKNILARSLLVSLGLSILYFSIQMLFSLLAGIGLINSISGAWAGTALSGLVAVYILTRANT